MMKDLLGEILDMKKGKAMTVTINIEPDPETEDEGLKKQGMAPVPDSEEENLEGESEESEEMAEKSLLMNGDEERAMTQKLKGGLKPSGLAERVKMSLLDK